MFARDAGDVGNARTPWAMPAQRGRMQYARTLCRHCMHRHDNVIPGLIAMMAVAPAWGGAQQVPLSDSLYRWEHLRRFYDVVVAGYLLRCDTEPRMAMGLPAGATAVGRQGQ